MDIRNILSATAVSALREFKNGVETYPVQFASLDEWKAEIDKMIKGFESIDADLKAQEEGLTSFAKWAHHLWS